MDANEEHPYEPAHQPKLDTERLVLRPLRDEDAPIIQKLAGDRRIAETTLTMPHPYEVHMAEAFVAAQRASYAKGVAETFAVTLRADGSFVGINGITVDPAHGRAEIGYWVAVPCWGKGYGHEAARALLDHEFSTRDFRRIHGQVYRGNQASRRILEKLGMTYEGCLRQHLCRLGTIHDVEQFGILREEWEKR